METTMTDYAHKAATTDSIYDLHCHYVPGPVAEGLSRLFSALISKAPD